MFFIVGQFPDGQDYQGTQQRIGMHVVVIKEAGKADKVHPTGCQRDLPFVVDVGKLIRRPDRKEKKQKGYEFVGKVCVPEDPERYGGQPKKQRRFLKIRFPEILDIDIIARFNHTFCDGCIFGRISRQVTH
jgi:hypothetical protein